MTDHDETELHDLEHQLTMLLQPAQGAARFRRELRAQLLAQTRQRVARGRVPVLRRGPALSHAVTAVALVTAAIATAGAVVGGGDSQEAFAGWSASPTRVPAGHAAVAEAECAARMAEASRPLTTKSGATVDRGSDALLTDTRGPYTLVLYPQTLCLSGPHFLSLSGRRVTDGVAISTVDREPGEPYTVAQGPTSPGVTAVTLALDDGTSVQATVAGSGFLAWWPTTSRPTSITIAGPRGTRTEPLSYPPAPSAGKTPAPAPPQQ